MALTTACCLCQPVQNPAADGWRDKILRLLRILLCLPVLLGLIKPAAHASQAMPSTPTMAESAPVDLEALRPQAAYTMQRNLFYANTTDKNQSLDLYWPKQRLANAPTLVMVHGGGWAAPENYREMWRATEYYVSNGYVVANVRYRVIPEHSFPAPVEDVRQAVDWVSRNIPNDRKTIAIGFSAGANLALRALLDNPRQVAGIIGLSSPTHFNGNDHYEPGLRPNIKTYLGEHTAAEASPLCMDLSQAPPVLLVHGDADPTVPYDQSTKMFKKLKEAGAAVRLVTGDGEDHMWFLKHDAMNPLDPRLAREMTRFIEHPEQADGERRLFRFAPGS